ncbi:MAG: transposase, partial [Deltaproteobacteria bacterium]|nr:transposase [Deltaproteobacteria bacterium]MBI5516310.1 transposase [Deltaproteobacteria bacterium]
ESNAEPDHVHLLLAYPPRVSLATLVQRLKARSSKRVRAKGFPGVRSKLRGPAF